MKRIIINIPEEINIHGILMNGSEYGEMVIEAVKNGTPIPDNAAICDINAIKDEVKNLPAFELFGVFSNEQRLCLLSDIIDKHTYKEK